ncbi:MAG TPA: amino acid adenylation domain-containing protein, partial [Longimicrobium sp.]|nr:amino acid adenylation domain-containing protein [Longimicrobium sp.]
MGEPFARSVHELVGEEGARLFDLQRGPMVRLTLLRVSDADYAVVVTTHHIATDGWSFPLLMRDLLVLYDAYRAGGEAALPPLPLRYADYAVWQRQHLQGENLEKQVRYWRDLLGGVPALDLPTDHPRPAAANNVGRSHTFHMGAERTQRVRDACRSQAATLNMVLLAAFAETLRRYSGQDDLVIGTLLGSRSRPELEPIIGMFVNSAALRLRLPADATFRDAVAVARRAVLDANQHQDLPFEKLVDELGVPRDLSRHPLYQVAYFHHASVHTEGASDDTEPALALRPVDPENAAEMVDTGVAKFDLQFTTVDLGDELAGAIEYATELFDPATIERMARHLVTLLRAAVRQPDAPLSSLGMMADDERAALRAMEAGPARTYAPTTIHRAVSEQAARTPDAVALSFEGRTMTYAQVERRGSQLAHRLRRLGVGPEVRVGVCMERGMEMVVSLLAVLKAGGAYVPLDPDNPPDRLAYMLGDSAVPILLTQPHLRADIPAHAGETVEVDPDFAVAAGEPEEAPRDVAGPDHLAYVIYTSGSTGRPKGAMNAHAGVINRLRWMQDEYALTPADVVLQKTPFSFDVSVWELFWPLMTGARLVLAQAGGHRDPAYLARLIDEAGVTTLHFVPSMLAAFLDGAPAARCRSLVRVVCSGEALPAEVAERFYGMMDAAGNGRVALHNLYGPTEAAVDVTYWPVPRGDRSGAVPIGRPVANTRVHVLGRDGAPVPVGVPGELYLAGVQVGRGYLGRPALTAEKFVPDAFSAEPGARMYRTGDRVRWRADGTLAFMGRLDGQVKLRGFRIELGEIESELLRHPAVRAAAAVLRDDAPGGPALAAYFVARDGADVTAADLRTHLRERLPEYMVPSAFVALETMPLTSSGKADRRALPAPRSADEPAAELVAPRNVVEDMVAEIWAEVLRRERVGVTQNYFELGGHSLLATQVIVRIQDTFEVEIPIRVFFQDPTIGGLAAAVEAVGSPVLAAMVDELDGLSAEEIEAL